MKWSSSNTQSWLNKLKEGHTVTRILWNGVAESKDPQCLFSSQIQLNWFSLELTTPVLNFRVRPSAEFIIRYLETKALLNFFLSLAGPGT
jgi:hypothetical protein